MSPVLNLLLRSFLCNCLSCLSGFRLGFYPMQRCWFMRRQLAALRAFDQQLRIVGRRGYMMRLDISRRGKFFLDRPRHLALRAVPANLVASFKVFCCHDFPFGCKRSGELPCMHKR